MGIEVFSLAMLTTPTSPFFFGLDFNHPQSFFRFTALDLPHEKLTIQGKNVTREAVQLDWQFNWALFLSSQIHVEIFGVFNQHDMMGQ